MKAPSSLTAPAAFAAMRFEESNDTPPCLNIVVGNDNEFAGKEIVVEQVIPDPVSVRIDEKIFMGLLIAHDVASGIFKRVVDSIPQGMNYMGVAVCLEIGGFVAPDNPAGRAYMDRAVAGFRAGEIGHARPYNGLFFIGVDNEVCAFAKVDGEVISVTGFESLDEVVNLLREIHGRFTKATA